MSDDSLNSTWARSSYCGTNACVEVAWAKADACGSGSCVEVAHCCGSVLVRDSKNPDRPPLSFTPQEWEAFTSGVRNGEFDV